MRCNIAGMDSGYYAAVTALVGKMQALDVTANNLANAGTSGFRAQRQRFESVLAAANSQSGVASAANDFGVMGGTVTDLSAGQLEHTGGDLDFGLEGEGFFAVQTKQGTAYTRNGAFHTDKDGQLLTSDGNAVLGDGGPIHLPSGQVSVSDDGTISVNGAVLTTLKVLQPTDPSKLEAIGAANFTSPLANMKAAVGYTVHQGALETSNVSAVDGAVQLINTQRQAEMMERVVSLFNSDFSRTAIEQVARG